MSEIKDIPGYEGLYSVDENGNIYSLRNHIILKPNKNWKGYLQYSLCKNGKRQLFLGHRLVAMTFIPNPNGLPSINHIDENKENNSVSNLEWCTHSYNKKYSTYKLTEHYARLAELHRAHLSKTVIQMDKSGRTIATFKSLKEAEEQTGINLKNISRVCNGFRKTAGGYIWKYTK